MLSNRSTTLRNPNPFKPVTSKQPALSEHSGDHHPQILSPWVLYAHDL